MAVHIDKTELFQLLIKEFDQVAIIDSRLFYKRPKPFYGILGTLLNYRSLNDFKNIVFVNLDEFNKDFNEIDDYIYEFKHKYLKVCEDQRFFALKQDVNGFLKDYPWLATTGLFNVSESEFDKNSLINENLFYIMFNQRFFGSRLGRYNDISCGKDQVTRVYENIFIGGCSSSQKVLDSLNIYFSISVGYNCCHFGCERITLADCPSKINESDINDIINLISRTVDVAKTLNTNVLVHCDCGYNRSVSSVILYLMRHRGINLYDSIALMLETRFVLNILNPYMRYLIDQEIEIFKKSSVPIVDDPSNCFQRCLQKWKFSKVLDFYSHYEKMEKVVKELSK